MRRLLYGLALAAVLMAALSSCKPKVTAQSKGIRFDTLCVDTTALLSDSGGVAHCALHLNLIFLRGKEYEGVNDSLLRLGRTRMDRYCLLQSSYNGIAEFLASISASLVSLVFNYELLKLLGEDGVAAYSVIMYFSMVFTSIFFGYCIGVAPVISYHFGAGNRPELKNMLRKGFVIEMSSCILGALLSFALAVPCSRLFVGYDPDLLALTIHAFRVYSLSYIFMGFGYFSQVFFTALNNGFVAGIISIIRIFVLQVGLTVLMAELFGAEALWYSMFVAQIIGFAVAWVFLLKYKDRYGYL